MLLKNKQNKRIHLWYWNWHGAASWRPTHISNRGEVSQKKTHTHKKDGNLWHAVIMRSECKETRLNMSLTFSGEGIIKRVPLLYLPHGSVALTPKCFSIKLKVWQHANSKQHSCTRAQRLSIPSVTNFTKAAERARCHTTTSCLTKPADQRSLFILA